MFRMVPKKLEVVMEETLKERYERLYRDLGISKDETKELYRRVIYSYG